MFNRIFKEIICSLLTILALVTCIYMVLTSYQAGRNYQKYSEIPRLIWNDRQLYKLTASTSNSSTLYVLTDWRIAKEQGFPWFIRLLYKNTISQQEQQNLPYLCSLQSDYRKNQQQAKEQIEFDKEVFKDIPKEFIDLDSITTLIMTHNALQQKDWQEIDKINCVGVIVRD